jgi:hypothetical protein
MAIVDRRIFAPTEATELTELYAFESDFVATLRCIPMAVRFKLDLAGIKLSLRQWSRFTVADRTDLLVKAAGTPHEIAAYRAHLAALIVERAGEGVKDIDVEPEPSWSTLDSVPTAVVSFAMRRGVQPPTLEQWRALTDLRRFTLLKLTRDGHDNVNFAPALREFGFLAA